MSTTRGRQPIDAAAKERERRMRVLEKGLVACYEIIDRIRKEMDELKSAAAPKRTE